MTRSQRQFTLSRRQFAGAGLATIGLAASASRAADLALTPESAMGPFFPLSTPADADADLTWIKGHSKRAQGEVITIGGRVLDVKGNPVSGAVLDIWQANAAGRYAHPGDVATAPIDPNFQGSASIRTDSAGSWKMVTIRPAGYDSPIGKRPPHIHFDVRGKVQRSVLQLYFPEEGDANARDLLFRQLGEQAAASVAVRDAHDVSRYAWNIVLMG